MLRIAQSSQFLRELYISLGSFSQTELKKFVVSMGEEVPAERRGLLALLETARRIVTDTFEVFDDGYDVFCDLNLVYEVSNMARPAKKVEDDLALDEVPAKSAARGRKAAPAPVTAAPAARRGRPPKAAVDDDLGLGDEKPAKKEADTIYVGKSELVWEKLSDGRDSAVVLGEKAPRGKNQILVADFIKSRGRKKTTAKMAVEDLVSRDVSEGYADWAVSNMLNVGALSVVE
jgi:hypothetical protein